MYVCITKRNWCTYLSTAPILVAVRSKAWFYGRSLAEIVGSNPADGHGCLSVVSAVCVVR